MLDPQRSLQPDISEKLDRFLANTPGYFLGFFLTALAGLFVGAAFLFFWFLG